MRTRVGSSGGLIVRAERCCILLRGEEGVYQTPLVQTPLLALAVGLPTIQRVVSDGVCGRHLSFLFGAERSCLRK
jgi:hypothetical protein